MTVLGAALCVAFIWSYRVNGINTITERFGVWQDMLPHLTLFGHGLGSFIVEFPLWQSHMPVLEYRYENPHNDFLQIVYESGIGGLLLVAVLARQMVRATRSPEWYCLLVFLVEGCFGFPLYEPVTGGLAALCAGRIFIGSHPVLAVFGAVRSRVQAGLDFDAPVAFRGCRPTVSPYSEQAVGAGLRSDSHPGLVEERYRRAGNPL
jgi:hypothetical protein